MAQDFKWKFFYDSSRHDIDEVIAFAEEEISENMKIREYQKMGILIECREGEARLI